MFFSIKYKNLFNGFFKLAVGSISPRDVVSLRRKVTFFRKHIKPQISPL